MATCPWTKQTRSNNIAGIRQNYCEKLSAPTASCTSMHPTRKLPASHTPAATDRLLAMFPSADQPATAYDERTSAQPRVSIGEPSADGNGQIATAAPTADLPVVINKDKRAKRRRSRTPAWMVYAATVAIGLGLGLGAGVLISLSRDKAVNPHQEIVSPSEGQEPTAPVEAPRNLRNGSETPERVAATARSSCARHHRATLL